MLLFKKLGPKLKGNENTRVKGKPQLLIEDQHAANIRGHEQGTEGKQT